MPAAGVQFGHYALGSPARLHLVPAVARTLGDPACVITDIQMPEMTGDQLQAELITAGRRLPMIFMTAFPVEATRRRVMDAGAAAHLDTPVNGDTIACSLAAIINKG